MSMNELLPLVEQYREAQQMAEQAKAEMEALKEQIKAELAARNTDRLDVGTHRVTVQTVTTHRVDGKAFQAAMPELAQRFTIATTGTRFVVA